MAFKFNQEIITGFSEIDEHHMELFKKANAFYEACIAGHGREVTQNLLNYLEEYAKFHLLAEENYMNEYKYSRIISHKANHDQFKEILDSLKNQFNETGINVKNIVKTSKILSDWLLTHIKNEDLPLAEFLRSKNKM